MVGLTFSDSVSVLLALLLVRSLMGVLSAPLHPALARSVAHWVPPRRSSRTNGLVNGAALVGIAITPPVLRGAHRPIRLARGVPDHGRRDHRRWAWSGPSMRPTGPRGRTSSRPRACRRNTCRSSSWLALFRHRGLVLLTLSYGCVGYFQYLFFYWMNYYFETVLHLPDEREPLLRRHPPAGDGRGDAAGGLALRPSRARPRHGRAGARSSRWRA